jgi:hypothetical protein
MNKQEQMIIYIDSGSRIIKHENKRVGVKYFVSLLTYISWSDDLGEQFSFFILSIFTHQRLHISQMITIKK